MLMLENSMGQFGDEIRRLRLARSLTLQQLGELVGVSFAFIGHLEAGRRPASESVTERLAEALGVDPVRLLALRLVETGQLPGADELTAEQAEELIRRLRENE